MLVWLMLSCMTPKSDSDCVVYYDKCNAGCELQCGSLQEAESVEICDLGCMDSGEPVTDDECVLRDDECTWLIAIDN